MSHAATKWAFDQPELHADMKPSEWVVLMVLADCHNPIHGCYPSQEYICSRTNLGERAVRYQLERLRDRGLIDWDAVREGARRGANRYRLGFEPDFQPANFAGSSSEASTGKIEQLQPANSDSFNRQNLPVYIEEPVIEPVIEPLREGRASAREDTNGTDAAPNDSKAIDKAFWRLVKGWPGLDGMPKETARRAFHALDAEARAEAVRKFPAWLALLKSQKRSHVPAPSTYFNERLWMDVPEPTEAKAPELVAAKPFGPDWSAARMAYLLRGPIGPEPALTRVEQALIDKGGWSREALLADKRRSTGWPDVNALHDKAEGRASAVIPSRYCDMPSGMEPVPVGSATFEAWRSLHDDRGWPWIPDPGALPVVWFPIGGPGGLEAFAEAVREVEGASNGGE